MDRETIISHLQIIFTWAKVNPMYGLGLDASDCEKICEWISETLEYLKKNQ